MSTTRKPATRRNTDLRRSNSIEVVDLLRYLGRLDRAELAAHTTLSGQALASILNDLVESGHVIEVETRGAQRGRGRPALLYEYNPRRLSVVSLYVGLRYCEVALCDGLGRPIAERVEFTPGWDVERVVAEASGHVGELFRAARIDRAECHVGAVVHGWVDTRAGTATSSVEMGWESVPIADLLADAIGTTATVHEASRAAAIAEYREGAAAGSHRSMVLNVGPEITATQVTDGILDTGSGGFAGMVGRCRVPGPDGRLAPIDELIGSFVTKRRYIEASGNHVDWMSQVYELARNGDKIARQTLELGAEVIGFATSWLITMANPERVVLTGAMAEYDEQMRSMIHSRIVEFTDTRMLRDCSIHFSALGRQAWIRGGVHAALDHLRTIDPLAGAQ